MLDLSSSDTARRAQALLTLLTIHDVARVLRTSRGAVYAMAARGQRTTVMSVQVRPYRRGGVCRSPHGAHCAAGASTRHSHRESE